MNFALPGTETYMALLSLATRAEPQHCSSRALKPLSLCFSLARNLPLKLLECFLLCVPATQALLCCFLVGTQVQGVSSEDQRDSVPRDLRVRSPPPNQIANFGRNCSLSIALPTNSSTSAILRESAKASPRFTYAIILTVRR